MFTGLCRTVLAGIVTLSLRWGFLLKIFYFFSRNEHMNKYEIENILQTKPQKSARELFLQGRWKFIRAGKSSRSPALQGRWFQMLTSSHDRWMDGWIHTHIHTYIHTYRYIYIPCILGWQKQHRRTGRPSRAKERVPSWWGIQVNQILIHIISLLFKVTIVYWNWTYIDKNYST